MTVKKYTVHWKVAPNMVCGPYRGKQTVWAISEENAVRKIRNKRGEFDMPILITEITVRDF